MNASMLWKTGAILLLALSAASVSAQRLERVSPLPAGMSWVNEQRDSGSFGNASAEVPSEMVEVDWDGRKVRGVRTPEGTLLLNPTGEWMGIMGKDNQLAVSWDPPLSFQWPLEVGKSWDFRFAMKVGDRVIPVEGRQSVEGFEDVTVPAGTFKAYRLRATDNLGNENVTWFSPDLRIFIKRDLQRTDKHPQGPGRREFVLKSHNIRLP